MRVIDQGRLGRIFGKCFDTGENPDQIFFRIRLEQRRNNFMLKRRADSRSGFGETGLGHLEFSFEKRLFSQIQCGKSQVDVLYILTGMNGFFHPKSIRRRRGKITFLLPAQMTQPLNC
ncbi:hypothetical protein [Noviherbaspirillum sedimenti]|uniref:hypothetical protein n=1 Tax=Noviherbaspirillum sedimenti TaxID=2320865 RepID=UPI0013141662|nr:hypothetical protein [Noviherbaspirillum sedimenti]